MKTEDESIKKIGNYKVVSLTEGPGKKYTVDLNNPDDVLMIYREWKEFKEGKYSQDHFDRVDKCVLQRLREQDILDELRVKVSDLDTEIEKLKSILDSDDKAAGIRIRQITLLIEQLEVMEEYRNILSVRIDEMENFWR